MSLDIPEKSLQVLERRMGNEDFSKKSLEEIANFIFKTTEGFKYSRTRAIDAQYFFPLPHEVEELNEICCGTRALYHFLLAHLIKDRFNLDYNLGFLITPSNYHAKICMSDKKESFILDWHMSKDRSVYDGELVLHLEDVMEWVAIVKKQNPLDFFKMNQEALREKDRTRTAELSLEYYTWDDDASLIFNLTTYNKNGTTDGAWIKLDKEGNLKRVDYFCPGDYYDKYPFDKAICIKNDGKQAILEIDDTALKCCALNSIYQHLFSKRREKEPGAKTAFTIETLQKHNPFAQVVDKDYDFEIITSSKDNTAYEIVFDKTYKDKRLLSSKEADEMLAEFMIDRFSGSWNLAKQVAEHYIDKKDKKISMIEADLKYFINRFAGKDAVKTAQRMFNLKTNEDLILYHFSKFQNGIELIRNEKSFNGFMTTIIKSYLERHGDANKTQETAERVLGIMFPPQEAKQKEYSHL